MVRLAVCRLSIATIAGFRGRLPDVLQARVQGKRTEDTDEAGMDDDILGRRAGWGWGLGSSYLML